MIHDRHADPDPEVFSTAEAAIEYARSWAQEYAREPEDLVESFPDGWLYCAHYGQEEDVVWVLEKELDNPLPVPSSWMS